MSHSDSTFFKPFAFVLGALIIFTLLIGFIATMMSPDSADDPLAAAQLKQTIAPVGQSQVAGDEAAAVPSGSEAWSDAPHKILVLGDSISAAYGIETDLGWVALLQEKVKQNNYPLQIVNASISGDTSSNGLARLPDLLSDHQPALVIIELGGNDGLRGLSVKKLKDNLKTMANLSKDIGADVIITAVQLPGNYGKAYNTLFQNAFLSAASDTQSELVTSLFEGLDASAQWFQSDGIHPSVKAQPLLLDNIWRSVEPLLKNLQQEN